MRFTKLLTTASALALGATLMAGTAWADSNDLFVEQVGDFNFNFTPQSGTFNETLVRQNGNRNGVSVTGSGLGGSLNGNRNDVLVLQSGSRSFTEMSISDTGSDRNRFVSIQRNGNENVVLGPNSSGGNSVTGGQDDNTYAAVQDGSNNIVNGGGSRSYTTGVGAGTFAGTISSIDVAGTALDAALIPSGLPSGGRNGHSILAGSDNVVLLSQLGSSNHLGVIVQGDSNSIVGNGVGTVATLEMNTEAGASFFNDAASNPWIQSSDGALSGIAFGSGFASQEGIGNAGMMAQNGNNNTILFDQLGNNNTNAVYQIGNTNVAAAGQY